jgi:5'-nucleotidase
MAIQNRGRIWPALCTLGPVHILVSNDDGIYSPGIAALAQVAAEFGTVRVVAPDVERSSASHAITAAYPLSYRPTRVGSLAAWRVNGTPADCVALGTHQWERVDLVLSGLNLGFNLGNAIWHSGTLAAAKQAVLLGVRGVALSVPAGVDHDFEPVKPWIRRVLEVVIAEPSLPLVNVNIPREPRGMLWTSMSVRQYNGRIVPTTDPQGRNLFWFTVKPLDHADEGTDRWAVEQDWISMTPLRLDLTDEVQLGSVERRRPLDRTLAAATSPARSSSEAEQAVRADEAEAPDKP